MTTLKGRLVYLANKFVTYFYTINSYGDYCNFLFPFNPFSLFPLELILKLFIWGNNKAPADAGASSLFKKFIILSSTQYLEFGLQLKEVLL